MADVARADGDGTRLAVRLQPRAAKDEVAGRFGDAVRIRVTAPPVEGAANDALCGLLARRLRVPRGAIEVVAGHLSRDKTVLVRGLAPQVVLERLDIAP